MPYWIYLIGGIYMSDNKPEYGSHDKKYLLIKFKSNK